jgi:hypothetical protein
MTRSNTRSKFIAATLAAVTLAGAVVATSGDAQARPRFGTGLGIGLAVGALAGATIASGPVYVRRDCYFVRRYNRWGDPRLIKVCDY